MLRSKTASGNSVLHSRVIILSRHFSRYIYTRTHTHTHTHTHIKGKEEANEEEPSFVCCGRYICIIAMWIVDRIEVVSLRVSKPLKRSAASVHRAIITTSAVPY